MTPLRRRRSIAGARHAAVAAVATLAALLAGCGSSASSTGSSQLVAVLSAMPSELEPNLVSASVLESADLEGRNVRVGTLGGVPVVLAMTGIGTVNAATVAGAVLDQFPVTGVVVSGVAKTTLRVADVTVVETWVAPDGSMFHPDASWLDLARALTASGAVELARCSVAPPATADAPICVDYDPVIAVGGTGHTSDPFNGAAFPCVAGGGGVFGCDASGSSAIGDTGRVRSSAAPAARVAIASPSSDGIEVTEMETAMIAREAAARGLPFIAFRATSDDAGNPLQSLGEFFHYYGLSADTASQATRAFLKRLAHREGNG